MWIGLDKLIEFMLLFPRLKDRLPFLVYSIGAMWSIIALVASITAAIFQIYPDLHLTLKISRASADYLKFTLSAIFFFYCLFALYVKRHYSHSLQTTIYVLLPVSGPAQGDGLLMAAGFASAEDALQGIRIEYRDHKGKGDIACSIVEDLTNKWKLSDGPLWIISTMSDVAPALISILPNILENTPMLKQYLTIISTVALEPGSPHQPHYNLIRYSIDGAEEIAKISQCVFESSNHDPGQPIVLASTNRRYPQRSLAQLSNIFVKQGCSVFALPPLSNEKTLDSPSPTLKLDAFNSTHAVVFGYDMGMFRVFRQLIKGGFTGAIYCPASLSVPDWQQYLKTQRDLLSSRVKYRYVDFDTDKTTEGCTAFVDRLGRYTFEALIVQDRIYGTEALGSIRQRFSEEERAVYTSIEPNYISALCFESVRIINFAILKNMDRLYKTSDFANIYNKKSSAGPLGGIREISDSGGFSPDANLIIRTIDDSGSQ